MEYAKHVSSFAFYASIIIGLVLMVTFWVFMPTLLNIIGVSADTVDYTRDYLTYLAIGAPFIILSQTFSNIIRSEGKSTLAMKGMMLGTITNIILDPILILGFDMGVSGAAIATVIGNMFGAAFFIFYLVSGKSILSVKPKDFMIKNGVLVGVLAIGIPASLNNLMLSVANIFLNNFLMSYGDIQLAAMGVAIRANLIMIFVQIGLGQGIQHLLVTAMGRSILIVYEALLNFLLLPPLF
nr:MATE family efflux transporter [Halolactibacillus sp. JCM 19043]